MPPLASICVPLYNKKDHLAKTLEVLLQQTYSPLEIVLSDNGSTDGSSAIAKEFAERDSRVRYYRLEHTVGINESWRYCWRLGKGEFLKIHSGDDPTLPADFLERMIEPMLARPGIEFTTCEMRAVVDYAWVGTSPDLQKDYFRSVAQVHRQLAAMPNRQVRARALLELCTFANMVGTPYGIVCRRSCLPEASWRKSRAPYGWPESYPDWDFNLRLFLNHRGFFVENVHAYFHYDASHAYARTVVDNLYELFDSVDLLLFPLTVLMDPELAALRQQATPEELAGIVQAAQGRMHGLMELSDEIVAFDHPTFTARVLPRLQRYSETFRRNPHDWSNTKRLRQLRMRLVHHWLNTPAERIGQEYYGDVGRAHCLILDSGIRRAIYDVREKEILEKTHAELSGGLTGQASWGHWLALVLLANFQTRPNLTLAMVPDWLRADFGKYAWMG
jgi:glycosyltransferase involved in cell wall biosynthesis